MYNKICLLMTLVCALGITACGKKSSSIVTSADSTTSSPAPVPKPTINSWSNGTFTLNLSAGNLTGVSFNATLGLVGQSAACICPMTMTGSDSAGTCTISTCTWNSQGSDPGCTGSGGFAAVCNHNTYTNDGSALHFPFNGFSYN